mgnify:CR=1 FL=1
MGFDSFVSPRGLEMQFIQKTLDENGIIQDNPEFEKGLKAFISQAVRNAKTWKSGRQHV